MFASSPKCTILAPFAVSNLRVTHYQYFVKNLQHYNAHDLYNMFRVVRDLLSLKILNVTWFLFSGHLSRLSWEIAGEKVAVGSLLFVCDFQ